MYILSRSPLAVKHFAQIAAVGYHLACPTPCIAHLAARGYIFELRDFAGSISMKTSRRSAVAHHGTQLRTSKDRIYA